MSETDAGSTDGAGDESSVTYVERPNVDEEMARNMIQLVGEEKVKPWTLVQRTAESVDRDVEKEVVRMEVLKPLMLKGVLMVNADGNVRLYEEERLESIV